MLRFEKKDSRVVVTVGLRRMGRGQQGKKSPGERKNRLPECGELGRRFLQKPRTDY
jgi:hypothetical protein